MSRAAKALSRSKVVDGAPPGRRRGRERELFERELRDFLDADPADVDADPDFKERLRAELWQRLRARIPER